MNIGRLEALDLFRKWATDKLLVRVEGRFSNFVFTSNGWVVSASDTELRIASSNMLSEVAVSLSTDLAFGYADNRTVTGEAKKNESVHCNFL